MIKRLVIVAFLLLLVFGGIFGAKMYSGMQMGQMMSQPPPPAVVAAAEARLETWQPYLHAVGSVKASQGVSITTKVAGQVKTIRFESGQTVKAGDIVLQLDDSVDQADLKGLIAQQKLARLQFKRHQQLFKERTVSQSEYDASQAQLDSANAAVSSERAIIAKKAVRAPFGGQLGIRQVDVGEYLSPGTPIVPLLALDPVYVDYNLPERHVADLHVGQTVLVKVQAWPEQTFEGRISAINAGIDPGTRTVRLRATLDNAQRRLRPGMFAEVRTVMPERSGILTIPRLSVTYNPYGESVFLILEQDGALTVENRQITTGEVRDGRVEVLSGLEAGDRVATAGHVKLRNGQAIRVDNSVQLDNELHGG